MVRRLKGWVVGGISGRLGLFFIEDGFKRKRFSKISMDGEKGFY